MKQRTAASTKKAEVKAMEPAITKEAPVKETVNETAGQAAEEKKAPIKESETVQAEEVKPIESAKKETVKPAAKKAASTKTAAPAKTVGAAKKEPAAKKASAPKEPIKESVNIQYADKSYSQEALVNIAKDVWKYDLKKKVSDIVSIELYVKPEENKVYYVINGENKGNFDI